jgi:hypothetical protein
MEASQELASFFFQKRIQSFEYKKIKRKFLLTVRTARTLSWFLSCDFGQW